jgi:hypothetical protein
MAFFDQPTNNVRRAAVRDAAEYLVRLFRKLEAQEVLADDLDLRDVGQLSPKPLGQLLVDLDANEPAATSGQLTCQEAASRADLDYKVVGPDGRLGDQASREGSAPEEVLG